MNIGSFAYDIDSCLLKQSSVSLQSLKYAVFNLNICRVKLKVDLVTVV